MYTVIGCLQTRLSKHKEMYVHFKNVYSINLKGMSNLSKSAINK